MHPMNEKRSWMGEIATPSNQQGVGAQGVGDRQGAGTPPTLGGGYLDNCSTSNFQKKISPTKKTDPRLSELRQMGLQPVWLEIAEQVGVDVFLYIWRTLDAQPSHFTDEGRVLVPIKRYQLFLRYQRNRYIETLQHIGMKPKDIRECVYKQVGETMSLRQIERLCSRRKGSR